MTDYPEELVEKWKREGKEAIQKSIAYWKTAKPPTVDAYICVKDQ
jgi:hypothetical protein